jgi:hypothetical protein
MLLLINEGIHHCDAVRQVFGRHQLIDELLIRPARGRRRRLGLGKPAIGRAEGGKKQGQDKEAGFHPAECF